MFWKYTALFTPAQRNNQALDPGTQIGNRALIFPDVEDPPIYGTQFSNNVDFSLPQHKSQCMCMILMENEALFALPF